MAGRELGFVFLLHPFVAGLQALSFEQIEKLLPFNGLLLSTFLLLSSPQ